MFCLGTGGINNKKELIKSIDQYIKLGGYMFDSAEKYKSGKIIKNFIKNRKKFYIISKIRPHLYSYNDIIKITKNKLLKDLNTDYLDELVIHSAMSEEYKINRLNTWKAFIELKKLGLVRNIGLSTFNIKQIEYLYENTNIYPDTLHIEYNLYNHDEEIYKFCKSKKIKLYAFSPLAKRKNSTKNIILNNNILNILYKKYNCNYEKLVLSWLISKNIIPISYSSNKKHLKDNFKTVKLENEDVLICDQLQNIIQINKYNCTKLFANIIEIKNFIRLDIFNILEKTFPKEINNGQGAKFDDKIKGKSIYNNLLKNKTWEKFKNLIYSQNFINQIMLEFKDELKKKFKDEFLLDIDNLNYQENENNIQIIEDIVRKRKIENRNKIPNTIFTRFNLSSKGDAKDQKPHRDHENRIFSGLIYFNNFKPENRGCTQFWSGPNKKNKGKLLIEIFPEKNKLILFLCNKHSIHNAISKKNTKQTRKTIYLTASAHKSAWKFIQGVND